MKKVIFSIGFAAAILLSGCAAHNPTSPVVGFLYTDATIPLTTTQASAGSKEGTATCTSILGLVADGDCSIDTAAKNGNITQIRTVDAKVKSILGLYSTTTLVVRGN